MQSEISTWLSSIPCGLDLKYLAKDFEDRGFTTKESLKYIDSSDLDVLFPSPLKLSYAKKKILLKEIEQLSNKDITQEPFGGTKTQSAAHIADSAESSTSFLAKKRNAFLMISNSLKRELQVPNKSTLGCSNKPVTMNVGPPNEQRPARIAI